MLFLLIFYSAAEDIYSAPQEFIAAPQCANAVFGVE